MPLYDAQGLPIPGTEAGGGAQYFTNDPYTQQLNQIRQAMVGGGFQGPVGISLGGGPTAGPAEQSAYRTAYGGITAPSAVATPASQISGYYNMASPYMTQVGQGNINAALAQSGFGPGPSGQAGGGFGAIGPYAELAGRLQMQMNAQAAQPLTQAAFNYTQAQNQFAQQQYAAQQAAAQQRYGALTRPFNTRVEGRLGAGTTGPTGTIQPGLPGSPGYQAPGAGGAGGGGGRGAGRGGGAGGGGEETPAGTAGSEWWTGAPAGYAWQTPYQGVPSSIFTPTETGSGGDSSMLFFPGGPGETGAYGGATSPDWSGAAGGAPGTTAYSTLTQPVSPTGTQGGPSGGLSTLDTTQQWATMSPEQFAAAQRAGYQGTATYLQQPFGGWR